MDLAYQDGGRLALGPAILSPPSPPDRLTPSADADLLEQYAFAHGRHYDAYLATEPGWEYFWSRDRRGVVALVRQGRYLHIAGGLLAPPDRQEGLLAQLVEHAQSRRLVVTFFNLAANQLPLFRRFGFQATKWGEEALVDLGGQSWAGKPFEWVRRQSNYCLRQGLAFTECYRVWMSADEWDRVAAELFEISSLFLAGKPQAGEMPFLQGRFDPWRGGKQRIFIARSRDGRGRIEGFLACNPAQGGRMWACETYRQRPDAVRGTVPFLIHQAMRLLQDEGVRQVSLCLIPGLRCRRPLPGDSALARWGIVQGTERFGLLFDTAGAYHFKTRFRPRFEDRYLCVWPKVTLGSAWAFVRLLGVLRVDVGKLCRLLVARWRKRSSRATLWRAECEDD